MRFLFICLLFLTHPAHAQHYTLDELLATPYVSNLTAARNSATLLFTVAQEGKRNVFSVDDKGALKQLTHFTEDDGQEITSLQLHPNGEWAVFVRGGDHGANSAPRPINPASYTTAQQIAVYSIHLPSGAVKKLAEGDAPLLHPINNEVVLIAKNQPWTVPLDGSKAAQSLFTTKGSVRNMQWSPDGKALAFTAARGDHAFVGIYYQDSVRLRWVAPSFNRDEYPKWSPDGKQLVFVRLPATGGDPDSLLAKKHNPWSIVTVDLATDAVKAIWKAPATLRGSVPAISGRYNLHWPQIDRIIFTSYQDGWPHLYSIHPNGSNFRQLTRGHFAIEEITVSSNGQLVAFSANHGPKVQDKDRRHIGLVNLQQNQFQLLTSGDGIETSPCFTQNDEAIAMLSNTAKRPLLPALLSLKKQSQPVLLAQSLLGTFNYGQLIIPEQVSFTAPDGLTVYGQLFKPKNLIGKAPAVVYVHGGPRRQMYLGWHNMDYYFYDYQLNQYLASRGFVVLSVNYRMGTGYGYEFQHPDNAGTNGASEYQDVLAAGQWLAKQPYVQADAIGIYGGSYGGYLTAMALAKNSDVFKAGVDIHGVHNRKKKLNLEAYPPDFEQAAKIAWESSPSHWVSSWKSPVLIIHADDDQNVDFAQSIDLVKRLQQQGVPMELLVIPDDTHHWMLYANLLKVKKATAAFLQEHLFKRRH
jgi:dipeptidyl aminopeptidase/acylaminoacyl peptidase